MHAKVAIGILIAFFFILLVVVFCVRLIRLYVQRVKSYTRLIYEKDLDHQKALTSSVIETQEQVLYNISRDLHDDAGQQLTLINFQIENLKLDSQQWNDALEPVSQSLRDLSESIRNISHSLNHQMIRKRDLVEAMKHEMERIGRTGIAVVLNLKPDGMQPFSRDEKIVIYRIFQEVTGNIIRHAKARTIWFTMTSSPFTMAISDDGTGFDPATASNTSMGMTNMRERAAMIGYKLDVRSAPGKGTTITLSSV